MNEICLTNNELCLNDTPRELLRDIWYHIWTWLCETPLGYKVETEQQFNARLNQELALHAALVTVRKLEWQVEAASLDQSDEEEFEAGIKEEAK